jgi:hypothetical protein
MRMKYCTNPCIMSSSLPCPICDGPVWAKTVAVSRIDTRRINADPPRRELANTFGLSKTEPPAYKIITL